MKLQIDWKKLKLFGWWLIGWLGWGKWLVPPVKCRTIRKNEKSLIGKSYYFCGLRGWKVKSPLKGTVSKIYPNFAVQITNQYGFQVLISLQVKKINPMPLDKIFQCEVKEGEEVNPKTVLFIVYLEEWVVNVSVFIPWQPEILRKVDNFNKSDKNYFVEVFYRNPYTKIKLKNHGKY